jgi:hypothetical protein
MALSGKKSKFSFKKWVSSKESLTSKTCDFPYKLKLFFLCIFMKSTIIIINKFTKIKNGYSQGRYDPLSVFKLVLGKRSMPMYISQKKDWKIHLCFGINLCRFLWGIWEKIWKNSRNNSYPATKALNVDSWWKSSKSCILSIISIIVMHFFLFSDLETHQVKN